MKGFTHVGPYHHVKSYCPLHREYNPMRHNVHRCYQSSMLGTFLHLDEFCGSKFQVEQKKALI